MGETDRTAMFYVYILKSLKYQKSYVGCTDNVTRRLREHNSGKMFFTKRFMPWEIVAIEKFSTLSEARKRESYLKCGVGRRYLKKLFNK